MSAFREICNDRLEDERGQIFLCSLPRGHEGAHESENMEWWNEDSNALTIHHGLVEGVALAAARRSCASRARDGT